LAASACQHGVMADGTQTTAAPAAAGSAVT
jgi:hypothetical protein